MCVFACVCVCVYICTYIRVYTCVHVCVCICANIHTEAEGQLKHHSSGAVNLGFLETMNLTGL